MLLLGAGNPGDGINMYRGVVNPSPIYCFAAMIVDEGPVELFMRSVRRGRQERIGFTPSPKRKHLLAPARVPDPDPTKRTSGRAPVNAHSKETNTRLVLEELCAEVFEIVFTQSWRVKG